MPTGSDFALVSFLDITLQSYLFSFGTFTKADNPKIKMINSMNII